MAWLVIVCLVLWLSAVVFRDARHASQPQLIKLCFGLLVPKEVCLARSHHPPRPLPTTHLTLSRQPLATMAQKLIVALYLVIISVRIAMKLRQIHDLHWLLTMAMEDGMSIFSFCMGVLFFHHKGLDGARAMSSAAVRVVS